MDSEGTLYLVGTPIGNLEDVSIRALRILREVDIIAAEDTRTTRKLLSKYNIKNRLISYYQGREKSKIPSLLKRLRKGEEIALVSEAGMPGISDPAYLLVNEAVRENINVIPVPGPSAAISAAVISGLKTDRFVFEGFLPAKSILRRKRIFLLQGEERTIICFESPRRLLRTLADMKQIMGNRRVAVARELTKKYEETVRGTISEMIEHFGHREVRGEIVLVIEGKQGPLLKKSGSLPRQIEAAENELGISRMEAIKLVAELRGLSKNKVYREYHIKHEKGKRGNT